MKKKKLGIPTLCKGCPNAKYFENGECNMYWEGKSFCTTKGWLLKME